MKLNSKTTIMKSEKDCKTCPYKKKYDKLLKEYKKERESYWVRKLASALNERDRIISDRGGW